MMTPVISRRRAPWSYRVCCINGLDPLGEDSLPQFNRETRSSKTRNYNLRAVSSIPYAGDFLLACLSLRIANVSSDLTDVNNKGLNQCLRVKVTSRLLKIHLLHFEKSCRVLAGNVRTNGPG